MRMRPDSTWKNSSVSSAKAMRQAPGSQDHSPADMPSRSKWFQVVRSGLPWTRRSGRGWSKVAGVSV